MECVLNFHEHFNLDVETRLTLQLMTCRRVHTAKRLLAAEELSLANGADRATSHLQISFTLTGSEEIIYWFCSIVVEEMGNRFRDIYLL